MHQKKPVQVKVDSSSQVIVLNMVDSESPLSYESKLIAAPNQQKIRFSLVTNEQQINNGVLSLSLNFSAHN